MANYYHAARAHVRRLKELSEDSKRRAERRAELTSAQTEYPVNFLTMEGHGVNLHRSSEMYNQLESGTGVMIDCGGDPEIKIDRYDGRALLDYLPNTKEPPKEASEMDNLVEFEKFRDLIRLKSLGLSEIDALQLVENENIEIRAAAKVSAAQSVHSYTESKPLSLDLPHSISSSAAAMYGTTSVILDEYLADSFSDNDSIGAKSSVNQSIKKSSVNQRLIDRDAMDKIGHQEFGISDFSHKLKKLLKVEGDRDALNELKSARFQGTYRKKFSDHDRHRGHHWTPHRSLSRRDSDPGCFDETGVESWKKEGVSSGVQGKPEFITEFVDDGDEGRIECPTSWDAMESLPRPTITDPASEMHDPSRLGFEQRTQARKRKLEEERKIELLRSEESARELLNSKKSAKSNTQGNQKKETPQERLKRFTAAQLEKQAKKDAVQTRQKRIQNERDQEARLQIERSGFQLGKKSTSKSKGHLS